MKRWIYCVYLTIFVTGAHSVIASPPTPRSILDEALHTAGADSPDIRAKIAKAEAKAGSCEGARGTFQEALAAVGSYPNLPERHRFIARYMNLSNIARSASRAGCYDVVYLTVRKATAVIRQDFQELMKQDANQNHGEAYHRLDLDLNLGFLYWAAGDFETLNVTLDRIIPAIEAAQWPPDLQFQKAARLLARNRRDAEAMKVLERYEAFYDREKVISKDSYYLHWLYRATNLAVVAETQLEAGNEENAEATIRRALNTAQNIPVARLNEVFGKGNSLQSAAFRTVAWSAARIGEVGIATSALNSVTDHNYDEAVPDVVEAVTKAGDTATAEKLVQQFKCCGRAVALGLAERDAWLEAVNEDEKWRAASDAREPEINSRDLYFQKLGEARTHAKGSEKALEWARQQTGTDKVHALLGIFDALSAKDLDSTR
jgi:hypothetical protein